MKIELIGSPEIIIENKSGIHNYFGWPSIAKLQNGKIAVTCSGYRLEHVCPFGKAVMAVSENGGKTYSRPSVIIDTPLDDRDSGITPFGKSGVIVTSFNNTVEFQRTDNPDNKYITSYLDTVTPEQEKKFIGSEYVISNDCGVTFGEVRQSPVTSPHGPVELSDGTVLWVGRQFDDKKPCGMSKQQIHCYRMCENGDMEYISSVPDAEGHYCCEPHVAECPDGTLLCHIRTERNFTVFQSESYDKGRTWTAPHRLLPDYGGSPSHILCLDSGVMLAAFGYREEPYGIKVMFSRDCGKTWEGEQMLYVNGVSSDLGYPATVQLDDGTLLTVFYAHPDDNSPAVIMQQKWKLV